MRRIRLLYFCVFGLTLLVFGCGDGGGSATCDDGEQNQDETDVDCGGTTCAACADGQSCATAGDCASGNCEDGTCAPAGGETCDDGVQNQDETDVDCGGATCDPCADGQGCSENSDCASGHCDASTCAPAGGETCDDGVQNQDETDVDCGGATCDPCADGQGCSENSDCASGYCDAGSSTCQQDPGDVTPPEVVSHVPTDGAVGVLQRVPIDIVFSEPMDMDTVMAAGSILVDDGAPVAGSMAYDPDTYTASFVPEFLAELTPHTVTVTTSITDEAGNPLAAEVSFGFTTGEYPVVLVSRHADGTAAGAMPYGVSHDGRFVVMGSGGGGLVDEPTAGQDHVYLRDVDLNTTVLVDRAHDGSLPNEGTWYDAAVSDDGQTVLFSSRATDIVADDTNGHHDVYLADMDSGQITRISETGDGVGGDEHSMPALALSADGTRAFFRSKADNLVAGSNDDYDDIYLWGPGGIAWASLAHDGSQPNGGYINRTHDYGISSDSRFLVFQSDCTNLVAGDGNGSTDVFLRDLQQSSTTLASVTADGTQLSSGSLDPVVSDDGQTVVFWYDDYRADELGLGCLGPRIYVKDMQTGDLDCIDRRMDGTTDGWVASEEPSISRDGRFVAFHSYQQNLAEGCGFGTQVHQVYVKNLTTGEIACLLNPDGQPFRENRTAMLSGDGQYIVFSGQHTVQVTQDLDMHVDYVFRARNPLY